MGRAQRDEAKLGPGGSAARPRCRGRVRNGAPLPRPERTSVAGIRAADRPPIRVPTPASLFSLYIRRAVGGYHVALPAAAPTQQDGAQRPVVVRRPQRAGRRMRPSPRARAQESSVAQRHERARGPVGEH
eukprot:333671-Pyramimonas_sp.AAC.1